MSLLCLMFTVNDGFRLSSLRTALLFFPSSPSIDLEDVSLILLYQWKEDALSNSLSPHRNVQGKVQLKEEYNFCSCQQSRERLLMKQSSHCGQEVFFPININLISGYSTCSLNQLFITIHCITFQTPLRPFPLLVNILYQISIIH